MNVHQATASDAPEIAAVLQEAAQWLIDGGRPLWSVADFDAARIAGDVDAGLFWVTRAGDTVVGVMKFELEDAYFWPEVTPGTSAFVHKLAVRRAWAGQGVPAALLAFALERAQALGLSYLRLDCMADREGLRRLYEGCRFRLHSVVQRGSASFARYEMPTG
jgi:GNAT superfamily N-acetyltransferase